MIEVQNAIKTFDGNQVLKNVSAIFEAGKTNLIIGQSGSGKTVLMKSIVGIHRIDSGHILYDGRDITIMKRKQLNQLRREIGMLFQGSALFDSMTVLENVRFPLDMFSDETEDEKDRRARFCLERVELSHAVDLYPSEISGGMKKRAGLARALALDPEIVYFDEPSAGLDPISSKLLDDLILNINQSLGTTMAVVTHELSSIFAIGNNSVFLDATSKQIIAQGNPKELLKNPPNETVYEFLTRGKTEHV